jgi:predicted dinucleotide-binding enzyme
MTVTVLGTGEMGTALARALARASVPLVLGSRDPARAEAQAARLRREFPAAQIGAADHLEAVRSARVVILAVGYEHARELLPRLGPLLTGRIVVDPTTPWGEDVPGTSGAVELEALLPPGAALVAAWKTTFAGELTAPAGGQHDVLLCGGDAAAKAAVAGLVTATGFRALDCGGLEHAGTLEGMTRLMGALVRHLGLPGGTVPAFRFSASAPPAPRSAQGT